MILRPYLQCESLYFHGLWHFYLTLPTRLALRAAKALCKLVISVAQIAPLEA